MIHTFYPSGVCSRQYDIEVEDNIIKDIHIIGGCNGNLQGISKLIIGHNIDDVVSKLEGIRCGGKPTSCPDQISKALKAIKNKEI